MITNRYSQTDLATSTKVQEVCPYGDPKSRSTFAEGYRVALMLESVRGCPALLSRLQAAKERGEQEVRWRDVAMGMPPSQVQTVLQLLETDGIVEQWLRKAKATGAGRLGLYIRLLRDIPTHAEYVALVEQTIQRSEVQEELPMGATQPLAIFDPQERWGETRLNPLNARAAG